MLIVSRSTVTNASKGGKCPPRLSNGMVINHMKAELIFYLNNTK